MTLPRGFSAHAERVAERCRIEAGFDGTGPVDIKQVARASGCSVVSADTLISIDRLHELERLQAYAFSACTFDIDGKSVIVFNPVHSDGRSNSDVAHELAHLLLDHQLSEIAEVGGLPFRTCMPDQEEQATALGAAILLPEKGVMRAARAGASIDTIAREYEVTAVMARYRWNKLGVGRRLARSQAKRSSTTG